jgi:hypothetical protein
LNIQQEVTIHDHGDHLTYPTQMVLSVRFQARALTTFLYGLAFIAHMDCFL